MSVKEKVLAIIEGKKTAPVTRMLLRVMSEGYRAGVALRNFAYDVVIPTTKLQIPVISVGNIVAGGTGKTPFVYYLAEQLLPYLKVTILSRGYGRKGKKVLLVKPENTTAECGDEPYLLAQKLPQAQIIVGSNRAFSGYLASVLSAELVILDDGMQYRSLDRDFEIGVMHADDLFGKGFYLPRGLLRDSPKRLSRADLIIINGIQDEAHLEKVKRFLSPYTKAPLTAMEQIVENGSMIASKKVGAFCAIANPARFTKTLQSLGCDIVANEEKIDHESFFEEELERLANKAFDLGAKCLVCTEKDSVKLPPNLNLRLPIVPLGIALNPTWGKDHLNNLILKVIHERRI